MAKWLWIGLTGVSLFVALVLDEIMWPNRNVSILYAIPVIIAALRWQPGPVIAVAATALLGDLVNIYRANIPSTVWPASFAALLAVCFCAILISVRHAEMIQEKRRDRALIAAAERLRQPLTVILGYAQLLQRCPTGPPSLRGASDTIQKAAHDMQVILTDVLGQAGPDPGQDD